MIIFVLKINPFELFIFKTTFDSQQQRVMSGHTVNYLKTLFPKISSEGSLQVFNAYPFTETDY